MKLVNLLLRFRRSGIKFRCSRTVTCSEHWLHQVVDCRSTIKWFVSTPFLINSFLLNLSCTILQTWLLNSLFRWLQFLYRWRQTWDTPQIPSTNWVITKYLAISINRVNSYLCFLKFPPDHTPISTERRSKRPILTMLSALESLIRMILIWMIKILESMMELQRERLELQIILSSIFRAQARCLQGSSRHWAICNSLIFLIASNRAVTVTWLTKNLAVRYSICFLWMQLLAPLVLVDLNAWEVVISTGGPAKTTSWTMELHLAVKQNTTVT